MTFSELQHLLQQYPAAFPRFILPNGDSIPPHAHVTEVGHVVRNFIDCGGKTGKEEKVLLQTHVGDDTDHRLRADRFARILQLGAALLPHSDLDVDIEYDCCVVAQYPIAAGEPEGEHLNFTLARGKTQCRARDRRQTVTAETCCPTTSNCCD
ncbi:MAG TPA: DUF6428 family protein [Chthoniobacterales bacterium]|nr:DUF6428 family protein [Chthoniobacterales bacterium]